jgi:polar amino acid transport system substrate-binding protein
MRAGRLRSVGLLGLVLAVALVAAGCGSNDNSGGGSTGTTTAAPAVDQALAAKVPAEVKSDGKIVIGTDSSYPPNEFLDTDGKTVIGFDVDLFNAVAAKLGLKTEYQSAVFDAIIPGLQSGKYEGGVSSFTINPSARSRSTWSATSTPAPSGGPRRATHRDPARQRLREEGRRPDQHRPGHRRPSSKRQEACKSAGKPPITIDRYQRQDQATAAVVSGKDDAMLADSPVVAYAVKQTNGQLELLGDIYDAAPYGYVIKKDQTEFAQAVADAVKALISDGTYKTILDKWGVQAGAIDNPAVNP